MMTVEEAAEKWGVDKNTVRKWAREGRVRAVTLADALRQRGLPAPKRQGWLIDQTERPLPGVDPIVRAKREPVEQVEETTTDSAQNVNGWWGR